MIDAHCHLYEFENIKAEVEKFRSIGGTAMVCCGGDLESSKKSVEIANLYPEVFATVGVHPEHQSGIPNTDDFLKLINDRVIAIGECGLDYYPDTSLEQKDFQEKLLKFNIDLAEKTNLPLVVHCRSAFDDLFRILHYPKVQMHCFTGNLEQMQECIKRGWYISFGGILTFKSSHQLREVAKQVPSDRLLVETDSPYLAPEPIRGSLNTPSNVKIVSETLEQIVGQPIETLVTHNLHTLFSKIS